ncbi:hypothetical protein FRB94_010050 [Tulasnella sp. JGI-2019a]|nr:hypothetical protein FRB93_009295 [Tulasnella sp. JGI-2019a]KAG8994219.1 hypothetical protein FRB94_010050 [Tulasnella sp. JGI-2019a]KAG9025574.1 hypothetical protein FRB95_009991 [Tulasnella sp. JGI-2019a]
MGVFKRSNSLASIAGASTDARPTPSRSNSSVRSSASKSPKPTKPTLAQRVSSSVKPKPKPQPTLLRRATIGLGEVSTTRWEKRMVKRIEDFPKDHPLLVKLVGAGICLAGAGAGAIGIPAIAAALGVKLAVVGGASTVSALGVSSVATTAGVGMAAQGTAVAGLVAAGAKVLFSTAAVDIGRRMIEATEPRPKTFLGFGFKRRTDSTDSVLLALMPSSKDSRK